MIQIRMKRSIRLIRLLESFLITGSWEKVSRRIERKG